MTILSVDISTGFQPSFSDLNVVRHGEEIDAYKPSLKVQISTHKTRHRLKGERWLQESFLPNVLSWGFSKARFVMNFKVTNPIGFELLA